MLKKQSNALPHADVPQWVMVTAVVAIFLLPLMIVSPTLRHMVLKKKGREGSIQIVRSRFSGKIMEIIFAQRALVESTANLAPLQGLLSVFADAAGGVDSFTLTERWRDGKERMKATEIKRRVFVEEGMEEVRQFWRGAVGGREKRVMELQPRGQRFSLELDLSATKDPRISVRAFGDGNALEQLAERYLRSQQRA